MEMYKVESSWIKSIGTDQQKGIIIGEFKTGIYQYSKVPPHIFAELLAAKSKGTYFNHHIIKSGYPCERLR